MNITEMKQGSSPNSLLLDAIVKSFEFSLVGTLLMGFVYVHDHFVSYFFVLFFLSSLAFRAFQWRNVGSFYASYLDVVIGANILISILYYFFLDYFYVKLPRYCRLFESVEVGFNMATCDIHYWLLFVVVAIDGTIILFFAKIRDCMPKKSKERGTVYQVEQVCVLPNNIVVRVLTILAPLIVVLISFFVIGRRMIDETIELPRTIIALDVLLITTIALPLAEFNRSQLVRWLVMKRI